MQALPDTSGPMGFAEPTTALPLLTLNSTDVDEFDYSTFLQDQQDIDYLAEESSGSTTEPQLTPPSGAVSSDSSLQGLKCEYPSLPTIVHQPQHQVPLFSLQDMRFFQHFLLNCYPHHPIGSEDLWTHEIPCLSQKYEYLMHAILGYSASELMATTDPSLAEAAMSHRLKAIKAIKRALASSTPSPSPCPNSSSFPSSSSSSSPHPSSSSSPPPAPPQPPPGSRNDPLFEEGNALMATCFALTYQSVLLDDGLAEYMTFIRGIMIVAIQMYCKGAALLFGPLLGDSQKEALRPHMEELGLIDAGWTARAVRGVEGLRGLVVGVEGREVEERYWELISEMAKMLSVSSWKAYVALTEHYAWWMMLPHDKFQRLVDPGNQVAILLGAHWIALEQIMAVICDAERKGAAKTPKQSSGISPGNIGWLKYLNAQVDQEHRAYNQWPMWVEAQLNKDRGFFGKTH
ncbi:hypothetical protein NEMBOFW57_004381 [Staphylotrichum longicolle]|uniref:Uncharacterized protein n=1 Tax=Staphylotrichum longicolle TaxID=669026 RepID=A0AAD4F7J1_9PEZI|nr:hypothetical protein NEMBOFW57_004381 [Staphylotrichum longicolle]